MILITGGACQGKLDFARKKRKKENPVIAEGGHAPVEKWNQADIIAKFHLYIRELLKEGKDPYSMTSELLEQNPEVIIEMNQLGCGIVPVDAFERNYRETAGRLGCILAQQAEEVWLVNAGIGMKLKGME